MYSIKKCVCVCECVYIIIKNEKNIYIHAFALGCINLKRSYFSSLINSNSFSIQNSIRFNQALDFFKLERFSYILENI